MYSIRRGLLRAWRSMASVRRSSRVPVAAGGAVAVPAVVVPAVVMPVPVPVLGMPVVGPVWVWKVCRAASSSRRCAMVVPVVRIQVPGGAVCRGRRV